MHYAAQSSPIISAPTDPNQRKWEGHVSGDINTEAKTRALLTATDRHLVLSGGPVTFVLPRKLVTTIAWSDLYPWRFLAISINHTIPGYPSNLQFKPLYHKPHDVLRELGEMGYLIISNPASASRR